MMVEAGSAHDDSNSREHLVRTVAVSVGAGLLTVAAYLSWLRWHDRAYYYDPAVGAQQGPYHPWQVVGLVITLGVLALLGGLLRRPGATALLMSAVLVVVWSLDASYEPGSRGGANLWPVGAVFLAIGSVLGLSVVALFGRALRSLSDYVQRKRAA